MGSTILTGVQSGEVRMKKEPENEDSISKEREVMGAELEPGQKEELEEKLGKLLDRDRMGGDGDSLPSTPPNESRPNTGSSNTQPRIQANHPFSMDVKVDGMAILLLLAGLFTRLVRLESPKHVVFDEMHYGKYASLYLKNTFFFDANPPLGKLLIAFSGYISGFEGGSFGFDKIGTPY